MACFQDKVEDYHAISEQAYYNARNPEGDTCSNRCSAVLTMAAFGRPFCYRQARVAIKAA